MCKSVYCLISIFAHYRLSGTIYSNVIHRYICGQVECTPILEMELVYSSESVITTYKLMWHHKPKQKRVELSESILCTDPKICTYLHKSVNIYRCACCLHITHACCVKVPRNVWLDGKYWNLLDNTVNECESLTIGIHPQKKHKKKGGYICEWMSNYTHKSCNRHSDVHFVQVSTSGWKYQLSV
jgi:hypothetical protein